MQIKLNEEYKNLTINRNKAEFVFLKAVSLKVNLICNVKKKYYNNSRRESVFVNITNQC